MNHLLALGNSLASLFGVLMAFVLCIQLAGWIDAILASKEVDDA